MEIWIWISGFDWILLDLEIKSGDQIQYSQPALSEVRLGALSEVRLGALSEVRLGALSEVRLGSVAAVLPASAI
jgi:hypothetical protein